MIKLEIRKAGGIFGAAFNFEQARLRLGGDRRAQIEQRGCSHPEERRGVRVHWMSCRSYLLLLEQLSFGLLICNYHSLHLILSLSAAHIMLLV